MTNPTRIAEAKLSLAITAALAQLQARSGAIHRQASARGMLKSGNTIVEIKSECVAALKTFGDLTAQELSWALSHTFSANPATVDQCNAIANKCLLSLGSECTEFLRKTVQMCGDDRHFQITEPDLRTQEQQSLMAISLALDTQYRELQFKRLRAAFGFLQRLLQVVFRYGRG
mgnify:FL=1